MVFHLSVVVFTFFFIARSYYAPFTKSSKAIQRCRSEACSRRFRSLIDPSIRRISRLLIRIGVSQLSVRICRRDNPTFRPFLLVTFFGRPTRRDFISAACVARTKDQRPRFLLLAIVKPCAREPRMWKAAREGEKAERRHCDPVNISSLPIRAFLPFRNRNSFEWEGRFFRPFLFYADHSNIQFP